MTSHERVLSTAKCVQLLRIVVCLATALNIIVLTRSLQYPTHEEDGKDGRYPGASFVIALYIFLNGCVLVGTAILLRYPGGWNHMVRLPLVTMGYMTGLFAALFPLLAIASHGGCSSRYYEKAAGICESQFLAGWSTLAWVIALFWEVTMSCGEQQRSVVVKTLTPHFENKK
ncbi:MAG: hypothetical protein JOS17DRAFT_762162 [Linnemannia elongata]|nr:MAG: hypothetical protein JOS17DRAFT_762162 [Linnemannia elongata]